MSANPSESRRATLEDIAITDRLAERGARRRDFERDQDACRRIARALARQPEHAYAAITEAARELCGAGTVGISLLGGAEGSRSVRRHGVTGAMAAALPEFAPLDCVPCREVITSGEVRLFREPMSHFADGGATALPVPEALIVPIHSRGVTVGTLWAMAHDDTVRFDASDAAVLGMLSDFATAAYERLQADAARAAAEAGQRTLDALLEYVPEGITIARAPDVTITRVSRYGQELTGRPLAQIANIPADLHPHHWDIHYPGGGLVPADDLPLTRATVRGEIVRNVELSMRRPDGSEVSILCNAGPIRGDDGTVTGGLIAWRDIDEFKQARQLAVDSQRRLDAVLDTTSAAIFLLDESQHCVYMNATAERLSGYTLAEARGRPLHDVVHHTRPDGRPYPLEECPIDRAFPANVRDQGEETFVHRDGTFYPVAFIASPIRDAAARTVGTVLEVRDLRPERAAETRLRLALRAARAGAWTWDLKTNTLDWSPEIFTMYGLAPDGPGTFEAWERSVHPDDRASLRRYVEALLAGRERELRVEFRITRPDGERWLLAVGEVERDAAGVGVRVAGLNLDVTHEKRIALALAESERRFAALAESVPTVVWSLTADGRTEYLNRRWADYTGLSPDALDRETLESAIHPDDLPDVNPLWERSVEARVPFEFAYRLRRRDGVYRWFLARVVPYFEGGRLACWFGTAADIDDSKVVEATLRERELALQEADRRKDEFIATLAHELRNPLAPVRNAVRVLGSASATPAQQQWSREVIERQIRTMARLLDDLLDAARITRGKLELRKETVHLWGVLGTAVETSQPLVEARGHRLIVTLPDEPVRIEADPVRLCQIVSNLLNNAAKYTPPGGRIELAARADRDEVEIEVKDSGVGLDGDELRHVFELFSQAADSRERADGGLGIGLALVKGLVELHGGRVEARSAGRGRGAAFVVRLPRGVPGSAGVDTGRATPARPSPVARRVLVADDNRDSAESLAALLRMEGHEVRTAYAGADALALAQAFEPEFAFLDIGMPGMSGYQLAERIRSLPLRTRPTLVAITGWGQADDRRQARAAGFDRHMTKPVDPDELFALLR